MRPKRLPVRPMEGDDALRTLRTTGWGQLGWVFYVQKDYEKAQPEFEKAVELEKDVAKNATYRHALGWIYLNTKQYAKAKQEFTKALEENPELDGAREGLSVLEKTPTR